MPKLSSREIDYDCTAGSEDEVPLVVSAKGAVGVDLLLFFGVEVTSAPLRNFHDQVARDSPARIASQRGPDRMNFDFGGAVVIASTSPP